MMQTIILVNYILHLKQQCFYKYQFIAVKTKSGEENQILLRIYFFMDMLHIAYAAKTVYFLLSLT